MRSWLAISAVLLPAVLMAALAKPLPTPTAANAPVDENAPWPETQFEIFKLAPGKQE